MLKISLDKILSLTNHKCFDSWSSMPFKTSPNRLIEFLFKLNIILPDNTCKVLLSAHINEDSNSYISSISTASKPSEICSQLSLWLNKYDNIIKGHENILWNITIMWCNITYKNKYIREIFYAIYICNMSDRYISLMHNYKNIICKEPISKYCKIDPNLLKDINNSNDINNKLMIINKSNIAHIPQPISDPNDFTYEDWYYSVFNDSS